MTTSATWPRRRTTGDCGCTACGGHRGPGMTSPDRARCRRRSPIDATDACLRSSSPTRAGTANSRAASTTRSPSAGTTSGSIARTSRRALKWFDEIRAGVAGADGVVFVISPDSAASEVCVRELELATDLGKRIVPAVCREPDGVAVPEAAASLNWVFLRDSDDFAEGVETLTRALETDLDHVRTHTRLGVAAGRWETSGRDASQLLRGAELTAAENWLVSAGEKQPPPTQCTASTCSRAAPRRRAGSGDRRRASRSRSWSRSCSAWSRSCSARPRSTSATSRRPGSSTPPRSQTSISTRSSACCSPCARRRSRRAAHRPRTLRQALASSHVFATFTFPNAHRDARHGLEPRWDASARRQPGRVGANPPTRRAASRPRPIALTPPPSRQQVAWDARGDRVILGGPRPPCTRPRPVR